jgi:hypothetical protein
VIEETMVGQQAFGWWITNDSLGLHEATVQVDHRDTFAEVALTRLNDIAEGDGIWGQIGIIRVVSDSGVEDFDPVRQAIFRRGVTSIRVYMVVLNGFARGRLLLNFWS